MGFKTYIIILLLKGQIIKMGEAKHDGKKLIKTLKTVGNVLFWTVLVLSYAVGINGLIGRLMGKNDVSFFGINAMVCESESMSYVNAANKDYLSGVKAGFIKVGDVVVTKRVGSPDDLKVGDIITYLSSDGKSILHRIVAIKNVDGRKLFSLRGDANNVNDPRLVEFSSVTGKFAFKISKVGYGVKFLQSGYGTIFLAGTIFIILLNAYIGTVIDERKKKADADK